MFKNAKIGDKVFDYLTQEWGIVTDIRNNHTYSLVVQFGDDKNQETSYTSSGKTLESFKVPTLFWDKVKSIEPPSKPLPNLKVDTKVIVWDYKTEKNKKYFSHFDSDGKINCFTLGATSWSAIGTVAWSNWELAEVNEETNV